MRRELWMEDTPPWHFRPVTHWWPKEMASKGSVEGWGSRIEAVISCQSWDSKWSVFCHATSIDSLQQWKWINNRGCHFHPLNIISWLCLSNCPKWAQEFWSFLKVIWVHLSIFWKWRQNDAVSETTNLCRAMLMDSQNQYMTQYCILIYKLNTHHPTPWRRYV